jgi:hypothetical protein
MTTCTHLDEARNVTPRAPGCEECLEIGDDDCASLADASRPRINMPGRWSTTVRGQAERWAKPPLEVVAS